ncbi:MAG: DUF5701 family protein [Patescibacteria group bacterium]
MAHHETHSLDGMGNDHERLSYWSKLNAKRLFNKQFQSFAHYGFLREPGHAVTSETYSPLHQLGKLVSDSEEVQRGHLTILLVNGGVPIASQLYEIFPMRHYRVASNLNLGHLRNCIPEVASDWYMLADVEVGRETEGMSPREAVAWLKERGRTPFNLREGISLVVCTRGEFAGRVISLPGSIYQRDHIPYLGIRKNEVSSEVVVHLSFSRPDKLHVGWGVPSYSRRIVPPTN